MNEAPLLACVDVGYSNSSARAACVTFADWQDAEPAGQYVIDIDHVEPYVPGQFYRRELPCLISVLDELPRQPQTIIVDGYVWLDDQKRKGLGAHLYDALDQQVTVIGAAKTEFAGASDSVKVFRGRSKRPLIISAVGIDVAQAAEHVRRMHGNTRIPTLLKLVDSLSRRPAK